MSESLSPVVPGDLNPPPGVVVMGSSFLPSVANLFMVSLEEDIRSHRERDPYFHNIILWKCYIDFFFFVLFRDEHKKSIFF